MLLEKLEGVCNVLDGKAETGGIVPRDYSESIVIFYRRLFWVDSLIFGGLCSLVKQELSCCNFYDNICARYCCLDPDIGELLLDNYCYDDCWYSYWNYCCLVATNWSYFRNLDYAFWWNCSWVLEKFI